jgi:eukaryotic-like serine/threonine-protein kinase
MLRAAAEAFPRSPCGSIARSVPLGALLGEILDRKYKLLRLLGEGGMGSVFEAQHQGTLRRVAVKVMKSPVVDPSSEMLSRFRREAKAAGAIESPHIVQILDTGADQKTGALYLVMEHLLGEDLHHLIQRIGPLAPDIGLRIAGQALLGLRAAHEAGIVHRDIKPANLFLARQRDGELTVKLLDFGLAKILADPEFIPHTTDLTDQNSIMGTPIYLSPEQLQSSKDVDARTDLWSLGSALYCALAGKAPYEHISAPFRLVIAICTSPPRPLREYAPWVTPEVAEIVHRALARKPDDRYPSAAAMLEALRPHIPGDFALRAEMFVGNIDDEPTPPLATKRTTTDWPAPEQMLEEAEAPPPKTTTAPPPNVIDTLISVAPPAPPKERGPQGSS